MWLPAAKNFYIFIPAKQVICVNVVFDFVLPIPNWPSLLCPHEYKSPIEVYIIEW